MLLFSCAPKFGPHPVGTKTVAGQPVTMTEPQRTSERKNIPAGVKPTDIAAHVKTKSGAETWVDKKGHVYQNEQAQQENAMPPDIPARPWYFWLLVCIEILAVMGCIVLVLYLRGSLAPLFRFLKRH